MYAYQQKDAPDKREMKDKQQTAEMQPPAQEEPAQEQQKKVEVFFCTSGPESTLALISERSQAALRSLLHELDERHEGLYDRLKEQYLKDDPVQLLGLLEEGKLQGIDSVHQVRIGALLGEIDIERMGLYELFKQVRSGGVPAEMHEVLVGQGVGYDLYRLVQTTSTLMQEDLYNLYEAARYIEKQVLDKACELGAKIDLPEKPHFQYLVGRRLCRALMYEAQGVPLNEPEQELTSLIPLPLRQQLHRMVMEMGYEGLQKNIEQLEGSLSRVHFVEHGLRKMLQRDQSMKPVRQVAQGSDALKKAWQAWRLTYGKISMVLRFTRRGMERHSTL